MVEGYKPQDFSFFHRGGKISTTDERNMHFMATLPIHEMFLTEEGDVVEPVVEVGIEQLTERQYTILRLIGKSVAEGVVETAESMARKLKVSSRTVQRELSRLQKMKRLRRKGADSNGDWEVLGRM